MAVALVTAGAGVQNLSALNTTGANFLIASLGYDTADTITDSKGNTWVDGGISSDGSGTFTRLVYVLNPIVGTGHTFSTTLAFGSIALAAFSGVRTAGAADQQAGNSSASASTLNTTSITPTENNELIITGLTINGNTGGFSIDNGFTIATSIASATGINYGGALAYRVQTTAAPINPAWSWAGPTSNSARIFSFKTQASSGGASNGKTPSIFIGIKL